MEIFDVTARQKATLADGRSLALSSQGKTLAMLFEKPSLRTRVSFEVAMTQLGGHVTTSARARCSLGKRETVAGLRARALSRYVDVIIARVFKHAHIVEMAAAQPRAGDQRAERLRASLPGAGRPADDQGALGTLEGSRSPSSATATTSRARWPSSAPSWACKFALAAPEGYGFDEAYPEQAAAATRRTRSSRFEIGPRSEETAARRRCGVHRRLGQHGPGVREGERARRPSPPYQVNAR